MPWIKGAAGAIALAFAGLFALPAAAQTVYDPLSTSDVTQLLKSLGRDSTVEPSDDDFEGDYVTIKYGAISYWIHFTACDEDGTDCEVIVFDAGFSYNEKSQRPDLTKINDWNEYHLGKAGIDKGGDPFINIEVNVVGGITRTNLVDTITWWQDMLDEFTDYIGWG